MVEPEELSREDLIALVRVQAERIAAQDSQIVELTEANEQLVGRLARLEHLLSRNSGNSSMPPSRDDDPGRTPPKRRAVAGRSGCGVSNRGRRGRTWPGCRSPTIGLTGFQKAVASVALGWARAGIWGSWTGISSMRSRW